MAQEPVTRAKAKNGTVLIWAWQPLAPRLPTQQTRAQEHQLTPRLLSAQGLLQPIKTEITETPADTSPQRVDLTPHEKGSGLSSSPATVPF
ncbi:hypothetical protein SRHO_G00085450 [Serrasalmus rhombeus]